MRVYVAGKFSPPTIARVREIQAQLVAAGHTITCDWTSDDVPAPQQAVNDMHGVLGADVFVLVAEDHSVVYCGAVAELGMAIASGLPIYVLGDALDTDRPGVQGSCIFLKLGSIRRADAFQADLLEGQIYAFHARH